MENLPGLWHLIGAPARAGLCTESSGRALLRSKIPVWSQGYPQYVSQGTVLERRPRWGRTCTRLVQISLTGHRRVLDALGFWLAIEGRLGLVLSSIACVGWMMEREAGRS